MTVGRWTFAVVLSLLLGGPLLFPFYSFAHPETWTWTGDDLTRLSYLATNTLLLVAGTLAGVLPLSLVLALLLFRSDLPGRSFFLALLVVSLFVPLPVLVSAWQGMFGSDGLLPIPLWLRAEGRPWTVGWGPAIWVHTLAGLPWAVLIIGLGLRWVEPELEEEALQHRPAWQVAWLVTVPRCRASIGAALLFIALLTAAEVSVTDMMLIATFAEEFHTQFVLGQEEALGRTLLLSLPWLLLVWGLVFTLLGRLERRLPPLPFLLRAPRPFPVRPGWLGVLLLTVLLGLLTLPLVSLVWKLGLAGQPRTWSLPQAWNQFANESVLFGLVVVQNFATALLTGLLIAGLALLVCWLADGRRYLRASLLALLVLAWVMPGPIVGIGLKQLMLALPAGPWQALLYYGPSPLPIMWVQAIRFLPAAVFFLWPVLRLIPLELREAARLEGAGPVGELLHLVWPLTWRAVGAVALAMTALCLGEAAASMRAETPGWSAFTSLLFDRMHYGADSTVAALSLLLLGCLGLLALVVGMVVVSVRWGRAANP